MEASEGVLKTLLNTTKELVLPSPNWAAHVCDGKLVLLSVKLTAFNQFVNLCKSVVLSEDSEQQLQVATFILQIPVKVPYLDYTIRSSLDLQSFLEKFDKVQLCKYFLQFQYETCETVGKDFSDVCSKCEPAHTKMEAEDNKQNNRSFHCNQCSETFSSSTEMKCHAYVFHNSYLTYTVSPKNQEEAKPNITVEKSGNVCKMCGTKWTTPQELTQHELLHFGGSFKCIACNENFNCLDRLVTHTKKYHPNVPFIQCERCNKKFVAARYLRVHMRTHIHEHPPLTCSKCNLKFRFKLQLEIHEKLHKTDSPVSCKKCRKQFPHKQQLLAHRLAEHSKTVYSCRICFRRFEHKLHVFKHLQEHNTQPFKCRVCAKRFKTYNEYLEHRLTHRPQKTYICPKCRKGFPTLSAVEKHACKEQIYKCGVCGRDFDKVASYKMHQRGHSMQKLFSCAVCKKGFSTKGNLAAHELQHEKERGARDEQSTATPKSAITEETVIAKS